MFMIHFCLTKVNYTYIKKSLSTNLRRGLRICIIVWNQVGDGADLTIREKKKHCYSYKSKIFIQPFQETDPKSLAKIIMIKLMFSFLLMGSSLLRVASLIRLERLTHFFHEL